MIGSWNFTFLWCKFMQVDRHFSENVLQYMDKFIKYVCKKSKFCTNFEDDRKSSVASFYYNKLI